MNPNTRIFALLSLGLLMAAMLVPFLIAAQGRDDLAVGFCVVAGLLALLFGVLGWSERLGRTVASVILCISVVGVGGLAVIYAIRSHA